jgi:hypothetical protein
MQNNKIIQSWILNKLNVERWNHEEKLITQKDKKNKGEKKH